ncbi:MAG TPA: hypothetical protein DET40_13775 [Lentisphaeria bacterium]|nr:MAG: hypothetical protein A2X45_01785 [Lentisphaerae bacterium GWF2_50_93]HCE44610.1 hypothetical protein [Lentisphaeria bacterium]
MARKRRIIHLTAGELNLTAMIDVAFQLLSFFVMTMVPVDILANMEVNRPAKQDNPTTEPIKTPVYITIFPNGEYSFNYVKMSRENLDRTLCEIGKNNSQYTILLQCTPQSSHGKMIEVLDICSKAGLSNLSVVSVQ